MTNYSRDSHTAEWQHNSGGFSYSMRAEQAGISSDRNCASANTIRQSLPDKVPSGVNCYSRMQIGLTPTPTASVAPTTANEPKDQQQYNCTYKGVDD